MKFNKILVNLVVLLFLVNTIYGYGLYFTEGDSVNLNIEEGLFNYDFRLVVDNSDWDNLVNANNRSNSYVELRKVGQDFENFEILENYKKGVYVDQGRDYELSVRLHLPKNNRWKEHYSLEVAGISPDGRQEIVILNVYPKNIPKEFAPKTTNYLLGIGIFLVILVGAYLLFRYLNRPKRNDGRWRK